MEENQFIASFKYEGLLVRDGFLDAKAASRALSGIDSSIKFFIGQDRPDLVAIDLPIPVRVQKGSWEALIPSDLFGWIQAAGGVAISTYLATAAKQLAQTDFKDKGLKDVFAKAVECLQWIVKAGKHLGHLAFRTLEHLDWTREKLVGLVNRAKEVLYLPASIFKKLLTCPQDILKDLASVIEIERSLRIDLFSGDDVVSVEVTHKERFVFFKEEDETELLFPELAHGAEVELEGVVTRGNEMANTIGFLFQGHILTCYPDRGSIVRFKPQLFLHCRISGSINRLDKHGHPIERRPKIVFRNLTTLSSDGGQLSLELAPGEDPN